MKPLFFTLLIGLCTIFSAFAQCGANESEITIEILTDDFPEEISFTLKEDNVVHLEVDMSNGQFNAAEEYFWNLCISSDACLTFKINDVYGDGIFLPGYVKVFVDGNETVNEWNYGSSFTANINCPPGSACGTAIPVELETTYSAPAADQWYVFEPQEIGIYRITTCDINSCDTKIWVYDDCEDLNISQGNDGAIFYNDNNDDCGEQADLFAIFNNEDAYYIRIGDAAGACTGSEIGWKILYDGPVSGCMDANSCNYNPLATIDDGSCIPQGSVDCPDGPDLVLLQDVLINSMYVATVTADENDCWIDEGCLQGYGERDVIRFTTHIQNHGELDYFIGAPDGQEDQFTFDNCHNHWHYDGYAEYLLFDENGNKIPIGFKNGFCVIDLECNMGGTPQYGCSFMGISAGCGDIYDASISCQWFDVTDVADGRYVFVARVNWDNAPDGAGRIESNKENNWAQACVILDRTTGELTMEIDPDCPAYLDCEGVLYGPTTIDCTGECGGTTLMGDLNENGTQEMIDAQTYVDLMLGNDIETTPCNDLNADENITVYDAALLSDCLNFGLGHQHTGGGSHNHCNFPGGVYNINDTVALSIVDHNEDLKYIDIAIDNPTVSVVGYQFKMSGIMMTSVESLVDPITYPVAPSGNFSGMVIGLSYQDSLIFKSTTPQPLARIFYQEFTGNEVCIERIDDIVSHKYEQVITRIDGPCLLVTSNQRLVNQLNIKVQPNPFNTQTLLSFNAPEKEVFELSLTDITGKVIRTYTNLITGEVLIEKADLLPGIYFYQLKSEQYQVTGKLSVL